MLEALHIPNAVVNILRIAAQTAYPEEACGLLIGRVSEGIAKISRAVPSRNVSAKDRARSFAIDPQLHVQTLRELRAQGDGETVVGVYHSHPKGPCEPSAEDARQASEDGFVWVIISVSGSGDTRLGGFESKLAEGGSAFDRVKIYAAS